MLNTSQDATSNWVQLWKAREYQYFGTGEVQARGYEKYWHALVEIATIFIEQEWVEILVEKKVENCTWDIMGMPVMIWIGHPIILLLLLVISSPAPTLARVDAHTAL